MSFSYLTGGEDKFLHFTASLLLVLLMRHFSFGTLVALFTVSSVGIGKELYDYFDYGLFSCGDLVYDFLGCLMGCAVFNGEFKKCQLFPRHNKGVK